MVTVNVLNNLDRNPPQMRDCSSKTRAYWEYQGERQRQDVGHPRIEYRQKQKSEYDEKEMEVIIKLTLAVRDALNLKCHRVEKPEIPCPHCAVLGMLREVLEALEKSKEPDGV